VTLIQACLLLFVCFVPVKSSQVKSMMLTDAVTQAPMSLYVRIILKTLL